VHALGGGLLVFEVQQNSDVTFRLYDWDRVDANTGLPRDLQIDQAIACIDFTQGAVGAVEPVVETEYPVLRELLFDCDHFRLWRLDSKKPFVVGAPAIARVLVCIAGKGQLDFHGVSYDAVKGDVFLLPAVVGACLFRPSGEVSLLEVALPEGTEPGVTQTKDFRSQPILEVAADIGATERTVE
jgi:mannose-6-phosphate isomerase